MSTFVRTGRALTASLAPHNVILDAALHAALKASYCPQCSDADKDRGRTVVLVTGIDDLLCAGCAPLGTSSARFIPKARARHDHAPTRVKMQTLREAIAEAEAEAAS